jgi:hypothetical protein
MVDLVVVNHLLHMGMALVLNMNGGLAKYFFLEYVQEKKGTTP